jgi:hypothetical protein
VDHEGSEVIQSEVALQLDSSISLAATIASILWLFQQARWFI